MHTYRYDGLNKRWQVGVWLVLPTSNVTSVGHALASFQICSAHTTEEEAVRRVVLLNTGRELPGPPELPCGGEGGRVDGAN